MQRELQSLQRCQADVIAKQEAIKVLQAELATAVTHFPEPGYRHQYPFV
jgi:hypothetical protein